MQWYEGLIPEAIAQAKKNKALFVVYIAGDDDESKKMDQTWLDGSVSQTCQKAHCVALRIEAKSDVCQQFAQIYPVIVIPTTFFIGNTGLPLEVIGGYLTPEDFKQRIGKVIELHQEDLPSESPPAASPANNISERHAVPSSDLSTAASPTAESASSSDLAEDGEFFTNDSSLEDKIDRARELIDQKRKDKEEKDKKDKITKEIERRKVGQEMTKIKREQEDSETRELADKIAKARVDEKAAREKVLKQIAQDREEKKRRYNSDLEMVEKAKEEAKRVRLLAEQQAAEAAMVSRSSHSRLQFRLPDGSSVTNQFSADDHFAEARRFISEHVGSRFGNFSLSTTFPRRDFTEEDNSRTLRDLQMVPTAVVILLPAKPLLTYSGDSSSDNWFWFILTPLVFVINLLKRAASSISSNLSLGPNRPSQSRTPDNIAHSSGSSQSTNAYKRSSSNNNSKNVSRRDGNVHRFTNSDDDKDDNNTWNGNSTQQM